MTRAGIVLAGILVHITAIPAVAAAINHQQQYEACMTLTREWPEEAYHSGLNWYKHGGAIPARHCVAVALLKLRQYDEAASRLERLALDLGTARRALLSDILMQAGQAWYLAGRSDKAFNLQSKLLDLVPGDAELWVDRAVTLMDLENTMQLSPISTKRSGGSGSDRGSYLPGGDFAVAGPIRGCREGDRHRSGA